MLPAITILRWRVVLLSSLLRSDGKKATIKPNKKNGKVAGKDGDCLGWVMLGEMESHRTGEPVVCKIARTSIEKIAESGL
jgi:hypothetical protein